MYRAVSQTGDELDSKTLDLIIKKRFWKSLYKPAPRGTLDEPFLLAFVDGLCEIGVSADNGRVGGLGWLASLGLVRVVGAFMAEHVPDQKHQGTQNSEDHHCDDSYKVKNTFATVDMLSKNKP